MTNAERYKTAKERAYAFLKHYNGNIYDAVKSFAKWLDLDALAEEPLPCPFCGSECYVDGGEKYYGEYWIQCSNTRCDYSSASKCNSEAAIIAHNNVARAVAKYKEVKNAN